MATIVTRQGKGSPLTFVEVDANFTNLNDDVAALQSSTGTGGAIDTRLDALESTDIVIDGRLDVLEAYDAAATARFLDVENSLVYFAATKSAGDTLAASLADGATVIVEADESVTPAGVKVRYTVASGVLTNAIIDSATKIKYSTETVEDNLNYVNGFLDELLPALTVSVAPETYLIDDASNSLREHTIIWHEPTSKYYLITDEVPTASPHHPNTYDTEIHLWSATDLTATWSYIGVCVPKGGAGQLGEYGVASPAGVAIKDDKIYVPFSARNLADFSGRSIGLAWSGADPSVIPWTKAATAISNTAGEDDDPALVSIDGTLHLYHRTTGPYRIVHTASETPEVVASWPAAAAVTVPPVGNTAQEVTAVVYYAGQVHMFIMEQGTGVGTAHLASADPANTDFQQYDAANRYVYLTPGTVYSGHLGVVLRDGRIKAFTWTVTISGVRYGIALRLYQEPVVNVIGNTTNPVVMHAGANDFFKIKHSSQLNFAGQFSFAFKIKLDATLLSSSDNYFLFYKGTDGNSVGNAGTVAITLRGGSNFGISARFTKADGTYTTLNPSGDISGLIAGEDIVVALTRDGDGVVRLYAMYGGVLYELNNTQMTNAVFTMALSTDAALFAAYSGAISGAVPFKGMVYEAAFYNVALTATDITHFAKHTVHERHRYTTNGGGEFSGCRSHYVFSGATGDRVVDLSGLGNAAVLSSGVMVSTASEVVPVGAKLIRTSAQSIPDNAFTQVVFAATALNAVGSLWDGTNLTVKSDGWYLLSGSVRFAANATGVRALRFYKNAGLLYSAGNQDATITASQVTIIDGSTVVFLLKGDVVDMRVLQTSGGALDIQYDGYGSPSFTVIRLGA